MQLKIKKAMAVTVVQVGLAVPWPTLRSILHCDPPNPNPYPNPYSNPKPSRLRAQLKIKQAAYLVACYDEDARGAGRDPASDWDWTAALDGVRLTCRKAEDYLLEAGACPCADGRRVDASRCKHMT